MNRGHSQGKNKKIGISGILLAVFILLLIMIVVFVISTGTTGGSPAGALLLLLMLASAAAVFMAFSTSRKKELSASAEKETENTDPLTSLMNQRGFENAVNEALARSPEQGVLVLFDLDHFKELNESFGREEGDRVLKMVSDIIRRFFNRNSDIIARVGGDEFAVFAGRNITLNEAERMVEKFQAEFRSIFSPKYGRYGFSVSMGGAFVQPDMTYDELHAKTEKVLIQVKESGRNGFLIEMSEYNEQPLCYYGLARDVTAEERRIIQSVYEAMKKGGEIVPFFQPKVDIRDDSLMGAEALTRWKKETGIVPPGSFLPLLEETGDICRLDLYIFEEVCRRVSEWKKKGLDVPTISSNFSMKHLFNPTFTDEVCAIADRYGVDHGHLEIEMTETDDYGDMGRLIEVIDSFRAHGFRTALDDFGSGYSSLSLVKSVSIDEIKLDQSLLSAWNDRTKLEGKDRALITHIVGLVKDMGMMVLVEGVETLEQKEFLNSINCSYVQGFLYDRPLPEEEFEKRIRSGSCRVAESQNDLKAEGTENEKKGPHAHLHILVAEDNEINREIAEMTLRQMGATVSTAVDGQDAFDQFRASKPGEFDLILMDIQMPVMDGYESAGAIRALDRPDAATVPIIAVTVDAYRETSGQARKAGMTDYITKPLNPVRLGAILESLKEA
ncbi:MAG: EAL domain-containing protein [Eubacterium sp.]|nr:EAL domain-containing protein [Eubacterium sp.]